jgi:galactokinase
MDQMAATLADEHHMLFIDTRTLACRKIPFPARSELVVIDSGTKRSLATSGYNQRRTECEAAARALAVPALRDIDDPRRADILPAPLDRRARHVITENVRVLAAVAGTDASVFGRLMNESHASLRDDFEVSTTALDALTECLQSHPAVYGARMTGAGFGGACVGLAHAGHAAGVKRDVLRAYEMRGYRGRVLV